MTMKREITVTVNGKQHHSSVEPRLLLVHYLRDVLDLTGTHIGCDTSQCGACTVLLNGVLVTTLVVGLELFNSGVLLGRRLLELLDHLHTRFLAISAKHGKTPFAECTATPETGLAARVAELVVRGQNHEDLHRGIP